MRNPLTVQIKGYPLWGWLIALAMIAAFIVAAASGTIGPRCTPQGECMDEF